VGSLNEVIVFSSLHKKVSSENFDGGKVVMVFSGGELDLTEAKTSKSEVEIEVSSVFSSIEITIPRDWKVRSIANVFLGNVDTHAAQGGEGNTTLVIVGDAVFGEIEVRK
jgi:predicted membrane protein